jgi:hypothetical protein
MTHRYTDIVNFTVNLAAVHSTDLNTLDHVLLEATKAPSLPRYLANNLLLVQNLSIVMRLPLAACETLESPEDPHSSTSSTTTATAWLKLFPTITKLERLRRLHIWLDHDSPLSWSVVNERAILSPLNALTNIPGLKTSVDLPKLHPQYETPNHHFTRECLMPSFDIERRLRQRYHAVETSKGQFRARYHSNFPYLLNDSDYEDMSEDEIEEIERNMWKNGTDVKAMASVRKTSRRLRAGPSRCRDIPMSSLYSV